MLLRQNCLLLELCNLEERDLAPLYIRGQLVEQVQSFKYLGAIVEATGSVLPDVQDKIWRASRVFGALRRPIFGDSSLSLCTKRMVYCSMVLGILLYGAETWAAKEDIIRKIESFHNRCMRCMLGVSRIEQRIRHLTSAQIRTMFGMETSMRDLLSVRRLRWLGHLARMADDRILKMLLFGWLPQSCPAQGGTKLGKICILETNWYCLAQDRSTWKGACQEGLKKLQNPVPMNTFVLTCDTHGRSFRRRQDITRHKCRTTHPRGKQS